MLRSYSFSSLLLSGTVVGLACAPSESEPVRRVTQEIVSSVAGPFYIEDFPEERDAGGALLYAACGDTVCLTAFSRGYSGGGSFALGVRVTASATVLDESPLQLGLAHVVKQVFARGDHFLVVTEHDGSDHYQEVDGISGAITDVALPDELQGREILRAASTGDTWAFVYDDGTPDQSEVYLLNPDFSIRGSKAVFPFNAFGSQIVRGPGEYLYVHGYEMLAARIDEATATIEDQPPKEISKWTSDPDPAVVYHDGVYLFALGGTVDVHTLRVNAADLVPIDEDDDFNEQSGAQLLYTLPAPSGVPGEGQAEVYVIGEDPTVVWLRRDGELEGLRIDLSTGLRKDLNVTNPPAILTANSLNTEYQMSVLSDGSGAVILDERQRARVGAAYPESTTLLALSNWWTPDGLAYRKWHNDVVGDGSRYFVVLNQDDSAEGSFDATEPLRGVFLDPSTGDYGAPFEIAPGFRPRVATDGTNFIVGFNDGDGYCHRIVNANGTIGYGQCGSGGLDEVVGLGFNGELYYLSAGDTLRLFNPNGTAATDGNHATGFAKLALHDWTPDPEFRTIVILYNSASGVAENVTVQRFRVQSRNLLGGDVLLTEHTAPFGASDGTNMFIIARNKSDNSWTGLLLDPVSGSAIEGTESTLFTSPTSVRSVSFDGTGFSVITASDATSALGYGRELRLHRFDATDLTRLDPETNGAGIVANPGSAGDWEVSMSWLGTGNQSVLITDAIDPTRFGDVYHAHFFDSLGGDDVPVVGSGGSGSGGSGSGGADSGSGGESSGGESSGTGATVGGDGDGDATGDGDGDGTGDGDGDASGDGDGDGDGTGDGDASGDGDGDGDGTGDGDGDTSGDGDAADGGSRDGSSRDKGGCAFQSKATGSRVPLFFSLILGLALARGGRRRLGKSPHQNF